MFSVRLNDTKFQKVIQNVRLSVKNFKVNERPALNVVNAQKVFKGNVIRRQTYFLFINTVLVKKQKKKLKSLTLRFKKTLATIILQITTQLLT